jgi:hypothetical protein
MERKPTQENPDFAEQVKESEDRLDDSREPTSLTPGGSPATTGAAAVSPLPGTIETDTGRTDETLPNDDEDTDPTYG